MTSSQNNQGNQHNSEFLLGLLLEENKHLNPIDFVNSMDKSEKFACVCAAMSISENYQEIRNSFTSVDDFIAVYFPLYVNALENYRSIVGSTQRQIFIDEATIFYPKKMVSHPLNCLVSNNTNKNIAMGFLDTIKNNHSCLIVLRDEIASTIIHYENDNFIIIDPHVQYCGILSKTGIYRYVVYDGIWDFDVNVLMVEESVNSENITTIISENVTMPVTEAVSETVSVNAIENVTMPVTETVTEAVSETELISAIENITIPVTEVIITNCPEKLIQE